MEYAYGLEPYPERVEGSSPSLPTYIKTPRQTVRVFSVFVRPRGIEPRSYPPQGYALSVELWAHTIKA